jgi:hypothetical protein
MLNNSLSGPTFGFCDHESVGKKSTALESTLKKHDHAFAYHRAREAQAIGFVCIAWKSGEMQIGDLLAKLIPGPRLNKLIGFVIWYLL